MRMWGKWLKPKIEGRFKTLHTPPGFAAPSSGASGSQEEAQLRDCLAHLKMEAEERVQRAEHEHRLRMRRIKLEFEAEKAARI